MEKVGYKNVDFTVWDVGGQGRHNLRPLWKNYFTSIDGLVRINSFAFMSLSQQKENLCYAYDFVKDSFFHLC